VKRETEFAKISYDAVHFGKADARAASSR